MIYSKEVQQKRYAEVPDIQDTPVVHPDQKSMIRLHIQTNPLLAKALTLIGPELVTREREVGNDYDHAFNTAVIAYQAGFGERNDILLTCILHDYLSLDHASSPDEVEERKTKLIQFCEENGVDSRTLFKDLQTMEVLEEKAIEFVDSLQISAVADFFTCPSGEKSNEIESFAKTYSQSAVAVKVCEIIEKFVSLGSGSHDLIEDETGIFKDNPERVGKLRETERITGALKVQKFYLPILEEIGPAELVINLKNRSVEQLAPKCYKRVSALIEQLGELHIPQLRPAFDNLVSSINDLLGRRYPGTEAVVVEPFLKSIGSTIIKMLKYGRRDYPELGEALSNARNKEDKQAATIALLEMMRDLVRGRIIVPGRSNNDIGDILIPSASAILKIVDKSPELGFRDVDLARKEVVQIVLNKESLPHIRGLTEMMDKKYGGGYSRGSKNNGYQCIHFAIGYLNGDGRQHVIELQLLLDWMQEHNDSNHGRYKYDPLKMSTEP